MTFGTHGFCFLDTIKTEVNENRVFSGLDFSFSERTRGTKPRDFLFFKQPGVFALTVFKSNEHGITLKSPHYRISVVGENV